MIFAVDWAGDPGIKPGSLPRCVMTVVACDDEEALASAAAELRRARRLRKGLEFHYARLTPDLRAAYMNAAGATPFKAVVAVYDKERMKPKWAWGRGTDLLVRLIIQCVLAMPEGDIKDAKMVIDGEREAKALARVLRPALSKALAERGISQRLAKIASGDSASNDAIQLADMIGGAVSEARERQVSVARFLRAAHSKVTVLNIMPDMEKPAK